MWGGAHSWGVSEEEVQAPAGSSWAPLWASPLTPHPYLEDPYLLAPFLSQAPSALWGGWQGAVRLWLPLEQQQAVHL